MTLTECTKECMKTCLKLKILLLTWFGKPRERSAESFDTILKISQKKSALLMVTAVYIIVTEL